MPANYLIKRVLDQKKLQSSMTRYEFPLKFAAPLSKCDKHYHHKKNN